MKAAGGICGDGRKEGNHGKGEGVRPPLSMEKAEVEYGGMHKTDLDSSRETRPFSDRQ